MALFVTIKLQSCCAELAFHDPHATHDNRAARRSYLEKHTRRMSALALLLSLVCALSAVTGVWFVHLALEALRHDRPVGSAQVWLACVPLIVGYVLGASVLLELAVAAGYARWAWTALRDAVPRSRGFHGLDDPLDGFEDGVASVRELVPLPGIKESDFNFGEDDADAMRPLPGATMVPITQQ